MSVLDGQPETASAAGDGIAAADVPARGAARPRRGLCPECREGFDKVHPRQMFCSAAHKRAWHNRATVRGAVLTPLAMSARMTRGGSRGDVVTGIGARQAAQQLLDRWVGEDRAAGRMSAVDYMRERMRLGL